MGNKKIEVTGFEPATSASRTQRSTKLSHTSIFCTVASHNKKNYIRVWRICQHFFAKNVFLCGGTQPRKNSYLCTTALAWLLSVADAKSIECL